MEWDPALKQWWWGQRDESGVKITGCPSQNIHGKHTWKHTLRQARRACRHSGGRGELVSELEASLVYTASSRTSRTTQKDCSKNRQNKTPPPIYIKKPYTQELIKFISHHVYNRDNWKIENVKNQILNCFLLLVDMDGCQWAENKLWNLPCEASSRDLVIILWAVEFLSNQ